MSVSTVREMLVSTIRELFSEALSIHQVLQFPMQIQIYLVRGKYFMPKPTLL